MGPILKLKLKEMTSRLEVQQHLQQVLDGIMNDEVDFLH
jgi:hypothetical protein